MGKNFTNFENKEEEFFEGFKTPTSYIKMGELPSSELNMDDCNSNLLIIPKNKSENLINKIISHFEYRYEDDELNALITKTESNNYVMLMTFMDMNDNMGLHGFVNLNDSIQLLDDATSTNDCLRALSYLHELKEYNSMKEKEFLEIEKLIKSQLSPKGWDNISQFAPELLEEKEIKTKKIKL